MSRIEFNKFIGLILLLIVLTLLKGWFDYSYAIVWLGVIFGYYLPFLDYLFYAYILYPESNISKSIRNMVSAKTFVSKTEFGKLVSYVNGIKSEMDRLIIHTGYFQIIFALLAFYILSSSGSVFGRGLVYGFFLKLFLAQILEFRQKKEINSWFAEMPFSMDEHKTKVYLYSNALVILVFSLML